MSRISFALFTLALTACPDPDDTGNPIAGDRLAEGVIDFEGHEDLDDHAFESSTPASNRANTPNAAGDYVLQIAFASDEDSPLVSVALYISSDLGVVGPGTYDVMNTTPTDGAYAVANLTIGDNAAGYSVTAIGATGTVTIESFADGRVAGSFDLVGDATWNAGTGANVFSLEGTFTEVPVNEI